MTHLSLFSGIGGLDLAAEAAGFETVGQCEWADYPRAILEKHWPGLPRWRDIRTLTKESFYAETGRTTVTVVSGGFPCQPFSTAGKRRGKDDARYLWPEMIRVIEELRPAWVVGENVAGIVSMALDTVLSDLEGIGYAVQAFVIPACAVDAPHRRDRVAIVGYAQHHGSPAAEVGGEPATTGDHHPEGANQTGEPAGAGLRGDGADVADSDSRTMRDDGQNGRTSDREVHETVNAGILGGTEKAVPDTYNRCGTVRRECQLSAAEGAGGGRYDHHGGTAQYGEWERWPTEPGVGRVAHGVPDRVDRLKCLGNAVVPPQFYPIFAAIAEIERIMEMNGWSGGSETLPYRVNAGAGDS